MIYTAQRTVSAPRVCAGCTYIHFAMISYHGELDNAFIPPKNMIFYLPITGIRVVTIGHGIDATSPW